MHLHCTYIKQSIELVKLSHKKMIYRFVTYIHNLETSISNCLSIIVSFIFAKQVLLWFADICIKWYEPPELYFWFMFTFVSLLWGRTIIFFSLKPPPQICLTYYCEETRQKFSLYNQGALQKKKTGYLWDMTSYVERGKTDVNVS